LTRRNPAVACTRSERRKEGRKGGREAGREGGKEGRPTHLIEGLVAVHHDDGGGHVEVVARPADDRERGDDVLGVQGLDLGERGG